MSNNCISSRLKILKRGKRRIRFINNILYAQMYLFKNRYISDNIHFWTLYIRVLNIHLILNDDSLALKILNF